MFWSALAHLVALLLDLLTARRQLACAKDVEIAVLRHQLRVALRRQPQPRLSRWEQLTLALLVTRLRQLPGVARRRWSRSGECVIDVGPGHSCRAVGSSRGAGGAAS